MEDVCSGISKMQQMRRIDDASQSMQEMRLLQQKRNYCSRLMQEKPKPLVNTGVIGFFLFLMLPERFRSNRGTEDDQQKRRKDIVGQIRIGKAGKEHLIERLERLRMAESFSLIFG